jgi:hypothetical protein
MSQSEDWQNGRIVRTVSSLFTRRSKIVMDDVSVVMEPEDFPDFLEFLSLCKGCFARRNAGASRQGGSNHYVCGCESCSECGDKTVQDWCAHLCEQSTYSMVQQEVELDRDKYFRI